MLRRSFFLHKMRSNWQLKKEKRAISSFTKMAMTEIKEVSQSYLLKSVYIQTGKNTNNFCSTESMCKAPWVVWTNTLFDAIIISKVGWLALSQLYRENSKATLKSNNSSFSQFHSNSSYERRGPRPRRWWVHVVIISWLSKFMLWLWYLVFVMRDRA